MSTTTKRVFGFILTLLLAVLFFVTLYHTDNKYTYGGSQPGNGLFVLSQRELTDRPLHFLWHGWAFYPDVLLTPKDFEQGDPARYMEYRSIGQRVHLNSPQSPASPHGIGTYALRLRLPKEAAIYAMALPEIFSAYQLYLNDALLLEIGNPDAKQYKALTQNRTLVFNATGDVLLLLSVGDASHFYSGMVYPPAFGTPDAISNYTTSRLVTDVALGVMSILVACLALYLGLRLQEKNAFLYALLCLAMLGTTGYTVLHTAFALPIFPWYALELMSIYLVVALTVIISNSICATEAIVAKITNGVAIGFCLLALGYGLSSSWLPLWVMNAFSQLVFWYKLLVASYLMAIAVGTVGSHNSYAYPLLYAAAFFAMALLCDRLFPVYEPMVGGWFTEWGSTAMVATVGIILCKDLARTYAHSLSFAEEHRQMSRQLAIQIADAKQLADRVAENRRIVHDFRQHLVALDGMAEKADATAMRKYLAQISESIGGSRPNISFCEHPAADAMLRYYYTLATQQDIELRFQLLVPTALPLTDVELCTVLGNLIENAIDACGRMQGGRRFVYLSSKVAGQTFFMLVENSFNGDLKSHDGQLLSSKAPGRMGVGLASVRRILQQYGDLTIRTQGTVFEAGVRLTLTECTSVVPCKTEC